MPTPKTKHLRIQSACKELKAAMESFEDETDVLRLARSKNEKVKNIKKQFLAIKKQLDQLN